MCFSVTRPLLVHGLSNTCHACSIVAVMIAFTGHLWYKAPFEFYLSPQNYLARRCDPLQFTAGEAEN
jgi:hypothetical protein